MSRFHSYVSSACRIIESYTEAKPFSFHLKRFFAADKKFGSRDRKIISTLCYAYFRLGKACPGKSCEQRILAGLFLSVEQGNDILEALQPAFNERVSLPVTNKLNFLSLHPKEIFPFFEQLSPGIDSNAFALSFLIQPDVFLRVRPGKFQVVTGKLQAASVGFVDEEEGCLRILDKSSPLDSILQLNREAVVQDMNSQKVFRYLANRPGHFGDDNIPVWDCCAASGGKSILFYDTVSSKIKLTVSDIRKNILSNLSERLREAKVPVEKIILADLSSLTLPAVAGPFSAIICDAPCTGSGTWSRTPEQLQHFNQGILQSYSDRQKKIATNSAAYLKRGGLFFYITCSVFRQENEDVVEFIDETLPLRLLESNYLEGYREKADSLFVAVFTKD